MRGQREPFRNKIMELANVDKVSFSSTVFGKIEHINSQEIDGKVVNFTSMWADAEYIDLFNFKLAEGRFFSKEFSSDVNSTALLNESAVRKFGVEDPYQINIKIPGGNAKVVGIVKDFNFKSLHHQIEPAAIVYLPRFTGYVNILISGSNLPETLEAIAEIWDEFARDFPFNYQFLDASLEMQYRNDEKMRQAIMYLSIIALAIAVLGIFALSVFVCEKRVKELGIHKVNGAKSWNLLVLLNRNFLIILIVAFVIACPVIWYSMNSWLERFAYRTSIDIWIYLVSGLFVALFTLTIVSWQSWRYANRNPVDALKYE
jgi:putative ABC transport system permease protein